MIRGAVLISTCVPAAMARTICFPTGVVDFPAEEVRIWILPAGVLMFGFSLQEIG